MPAHLTTNILSGWSWSRAPGVTDLQHVTFFPPRKVWNRLKIHSHLVLSRVTLKKLSSILFLMYLHYVQIKKGHSSFSTYKPFERGEIYEGVTSIKVKSTNKGIYSVQYLKNDEYTSPWAFHSTFYSKTNLGEKGTEATRRFQCCCQGAALTWSRSRGTPEGTTRPVRVVAHSDCTVTLPASMPLGTAWNCVSQVLAVGAVLGSTGISPQ